MGEQVGNETLGSDLAVYQRSNILWMWGSNRLPRTSALCSSLSCTVAWHRDWLYFHCRMTHSRRESEAGMVGSHQCDRKICGEHKSAEYHRGCRRSRSSGVGRKWWYRFCLFQNCNGWSRYYQGRLLGTDNIPGESKKCSGRVGRDGQANYSRWLDPRTSPYHRLHARPY